MRGIYVEIDVTDWPLDRSEPLGTKPKRWLRKPGHDERWLMKDATYSIRADGTTYLKGDDWAERIASGIADCLRLPAARTELVVRRFDTDDRLGVISKSVVERREELVLGNQLLAQPVSRHRREGYTIRAILKALADVNAPPDAEGGLSAWDVFAGYLLLDALIGNTDRHEQNWAVIVGGESLCLAPSFDHASSLGFLLDPRERERRLTTRDLGYAPEAWADRAKSEFEGKPHPVEAFREAYAMLDSGARDRWLERCENVDRLVEPIWLVPEHRMSRPAREFAERVVRRNHQRLLTV
ncbi:MAG: HipA domain-containing protein [bacterium]|nr:HipA domain-containing protein [bacterium]MXZ30126.1 hypothetical protein [Acidimicrobiia bacterium]MYJ13400.1 hypothetical protein [Acidimicrobiia bacterium]